MGHLFQELKRRKVFPIAAVYAIVAWVLIQVADVVLPTFEAPAWVNQTLIFLLILGFPIALILTWAYEVIPEGIRTDAGAQSVTAPAQSTDRKLIYLILALVVMVAGFQIADRFLVNQTGTSLAGNQASDSSDSSTRVVRSTLSLGDLLPVGEYGIRTGFGFAADGSRFSYVSSNSPSHQIYIPDIQLAAQTTFQTSVLSWVDRTGAETMLDMVPQPFRVPELSPDGNRVALTIQQDQYRLQNDIWSYDLDRGSLSRVTYSGFVSSLLWSADGDRLIYGTGRGIRSINATGLGQTEELTNIVSLSAYSPSPATISTDGQQILFTHFDGPGPSSNIHLLNTTPEHQSVPLINSEFDELGAVISPDGRWLAYTSNETGRNEVYVRPFPEIDAGKWPIS